MNKSKERVSCKYYIFVVFVYFIVGSVFEVDGRAATISQDSNYNFTITNETNDLIQDDQPMPIGKNSSFEEINEIEESGERIRLDESINKEWIPTPINSKSEDINFKDIFENPATAKLSYGESKLEFENYESDESDRNRNTIYYHSVGWPVGIIALILICLRFCRCLQYVSNDERRVRTGIPYRILVVERGGAPGTTAQQPTGFTNPALVTNDEQPQLDMPPPYEAVVSEQVTHANLPSIPDTAKQPVTQNEE